MARSSRPPKGCRRTRGPIAVVPSFSIHLSLCSAGFHRFPRYYKEIRLLQGHRPIVVASSGSTARADPCRSPWVRTLDVPPLPPPLPSQPRLDFGRRVLRHADPAGAACTEVHLRSVLRFASGFFPTRPHGARAIGVSRRQTLRAVASSSRLLPTRPAKDFHLQSSAHARHTSTARRKGPRGRKQSRVSSTDRLDCFVAALLAMTATFKPWRSGRQGSRRHRAGAAAGRSAGRRCADGSSATRPNHAGTTARPDGCPA